MKWNHTTESPLVAAWLVQQAERYGGRVQPLVNELLLAVAEGRLVDPAPLAATIAQLERQNAQLYELLQRAISPGAPSTPRTGEPKPPASGGLTFTT